MDANSPTTTRRTTATERRKKAVALRIAGATFEQIGDQLGVSTQAAHKLVTTALEETRRITGEAAEQLRQTELTRLDALQTALWSDAVKGDVQAVDRILKIMQRRAMLLGLDAPTVQAVVDWRSKATSAGYDPDELLRRVRAAMEALKGDAPK